MKTLKRCFFLLGGPLGLLILSSCAGLSMKPAEVVFDDPSRWLMVLPSEPTDKEKEGITLRFSPDPAETAQFREENLIYSNIKDGKGSPLKFTGYRTETYAVGGRKDSFVVSSETTFEGQGGKLREEYEQTRQGEILRFIGGSHRSKVGTFDIVDWKRSPVFPPTPVKIGDTWSYDEEMEVRIRSIWVKEVDPEPYQIKVESVLEGFARVGGIRCAVIRNRTRQVKREHFKMLFKEMIFDIHTQIDEVSYFDYAAGVLMGRVARSRSYTEGVNIGINMDGQGQLVMVREKPPSS